MKLLNICLVSILFVLLITFAFYSQYGNPLGPERFKDIYVPSTFYAHPMTKQEKLGSLYTPIILRPKENVSLKYNKDCPNQLYPAQTTSYGKGEMGSPNAKVEASYYAQRPILNPNEYERMLHLLFDAIKDQSSVPASIEKSLFVHQDEFCQDNCYPDVMAYIMKRINKTKKKVPEMVEYARVDTWGGEQFAFVDQKVYSFSRFNANDLSEQEQAKLARLSHEPKKLVVNFDLHNTLRSISTNVTAVVYYRNGKYYLDSIDTTTKPNQTKADPAPRSPVPQWIYANTLENQFFNNKGFHDPDQENIYIQGGVPQEFEGILDQMEQAYIMKPYNAQTLNGGPLHASPNANQTNAKINPVPNTTWSVYV
jgi:hypothetical protein